MNHHPNFEPTAQVADALSLLATLFEPDDRILIRPIESWTEQGRKRSQVSYRHVQYWSAHAPELAQHLTQLLPIAATQRLNLYYGVCPRLGDGGRYDLAWQIRTVRCLWADLDHTTPAEARQRIQNTNLPEPTLVVDSGHGVHLYWRLHPDVAISDVEAPPAIETRWREGPAGQRLPEKYYQVGNDEIPFDPRRPPLPLGPQGKLIQQILSGIAHRLGGDHTTDLARLLRLPGTLNRKDQRNGQAPVLSSLVECHPERRYPFELFTALARESPAAQREAQIQAMPLPTPRKPSPRRLDQLAEWIARCTLAKAGQRSEVDFGLCCFALRQGIAADEVWARVANIGKFAECGRRYFDTTWANATREVQTEIFHKFSRTTHTPPASPVSGSTDHAPLEAPNEPDEPDDSRDGAPDQPVITIDAGSTPVGETLQQITDRLLEVGGCYRRTDQFVVVHNERLQTILTVPELSGLLNQHVEFFVPHGQNGTFQPLPANYAHTWLHHAIQRDRLPAITLFTHNPVFTCDDRLVAPGFDAATGIYYAGPPIPACTGTEHLDRLLYDFCFHTPGDRTNFLAMLLTTVLMPRFIGSKPAVLFNGNQPGLGKSILAQILAILRDGQPVPTASYNPNDEEFEKRLGSLVRQGLTTLIIDNAKGRGHAAKIESACLERSITDPILSFRLLKHSLDIRAENSHIFCITANSPDVSRDLITRSIVVNLHFEGDPSRRSFLIADPEDYARDHRLELLGELIGMVERWFRAGRPRTEAASRFNKKGWGPIIGGILACNNQPDFLANAHTAATQLDDTRRDFTELVTLMADSSQSLWTATELVALCQKHTLLATELGTGSVRSRATRFGLIAGRYLHTSVDLPGGCQGTFRRDEEGDVRLYRIEVILRTL